MTPIELKKSLLQQERQLANNAPTLQTTSHQQFSKVGRIRRRRFDGQATNEGYGVGVMQRLHRGTKG